MRTRRGIGPRLPIQLPLHSKRHPTQFFPAAILLPARTATKPLPPDPIVLPSIKLPLPRATITHATKLLDQQFWCWGQDIVRPKRNALLDFGFTRHAPPPESKQISHYVLNEVTGPSLKPKRGRRVGLWGSGLFFGHPDMGAIYIRRYTLDPVCMDFLCPIESVGIPEEFPPPPPVSAEDEMPAVMHMMVNLCQWLAHYEAWAQSHLGRKHRDGCLRDWKKTVASTTEMVAEWQRLAEVFGQVLAAETE